MSNFAKRPLPASPATASGLGRFRRIQRAKAAVMKWQSSLASA
ncbi:hypothetical protein SRABI128_05729 [Microbacterium sp. Bi128]|nr:hypothetical protein SRABI128_05729 [Microbacterium sp. Bi128]